MTDIDLADLAAAYRLRPMSAAADKRAATAARRSLDPLLDVGAGPGYHAGVWAAMGRAAVALDISEAMMVKASEHRHVTAVQGSGETLPFADQSFGLAYFHMSIHYGDWRRSLTEARRVVRPGGRIEIWTFDPAAMARTSLGRWFPSVAAIDSERFPDPTDLAAHCASIVSTVAVSTADEPIVRTAAAWEHAVRGRFVSTLQLIDDRELEEGIGAFREQYPNDDTAYRYIAPFTAVTCVV
jgi:SAM-dependent methyltransferase